METIVQGGNSQNPYKQFTYAIQPQQSETIFYALNYFRVLDLTGDPANMRIRFGSSGSFSEFVGAGIGFEMPQAVERVDITNTSTTDVLMVTIAVAIGRIDDNRLNVSGNVNVVNSAGTELKTHDTDVLAMLQDDKLQRAGLTPVGNHFYGATLGAVATVLAPATNVNGVIIRSCSLIGYGGSRSGLYVGNSAPSSVTDMSVAQVLRAIGGIAQAENIYIPAGYGIYAAGASASACEIAMTYDVL